MPGFHRSVAVLPLCRSAAVPLCRCAAVPFGSGVSEGGGVDGLVGRGPVSLLLLLLLVVLVVVVEEGGVSVVEPMTAHARRLLVLVEVAAQRERLATAPAHVRLVGRVRLDVRAKVRLVGERLGAVRTAEWLLAGVCPDVALQQQPHTPGQLSLASLRGRLIEYQLRLG